MFSTGLQQKPGPKLYHFCPSTAWLVISAALPEVCREACTLAIYKALPELEIQNQPEPKESGTACTCSAEPLITLKEAFSSYPANFVCTARQSTWEKLSEDSWSLLDIGRLYSSNILALEHITDGSYIAKVPSLFLPAPHFREDICCGDEK